MALNLEFQKFCERWIEKSKSYNTSELNQCIDKFATLYIAYNALYVETAAYLHRKAAKEGKDGYKLKGDRFPDKQAATRYVLDIIGSKTLLDALGNDPDTRSAVEKLDGLMEQQVFDIVLDPVWGTAKKGEDKKLHKMLKSPGSDRAQAMLTIIYEVRCNLFHGRKGLDAVQKDLLVPLTVILEKVIDLLYERLKRASYV